jgi:hypothetical protein
MPRTRRDVWKLGSDWNDTILWYARAVKVMSARPFSDMTSWRYLAAMHGAAEQLWRSNGYMKPGENLPGAIAFRREDRDQCQHHTWYFLPWHRGYLRAFERIVAAAIVQLGGPAGWALPYWNYNDESNPNRLHLPPAFGSQTWPDGGTNPLFVVARYGSTGQSGGPITLDPRSVSLDAAFLEDSFVGTQIGGSPGFGGGRTPFKHSGRGDEGLLEQSPHDNVHGDIGGARDNDFMDPFKIGLMSNPSTAGLDPIFWLHHSNVDRLWESWLQAAGHVNPTDESAWMDGPVGNRPFVMPEPDNSTRTTFLRARCWIQPGPNWTIFTRTSRTRLPRASAWPSGWKAWALPPPPSRPSNQQPNEIWRESRRSNYWARMRKASASPGRKPPRPCRSIRRPAARCSRVSVRVSSRPRRGSPIACSSISRTSRPRATQPRSASMSG